MLKFETRSAPYTLRSAGGVELGVINYGGAIVSLKVPDRDGRFADVVPGFDTLDGYLNHTAYFGAIIGRCANRIRNGRFTLDGRTHTLATNDGTHHLHGGVRGFDKVIWEAAPFENARGSGLELRYLSPDGEEGYPGTVNVQVTYTLTAEDELIVDYYASTDRATPINLTQHSYFNLAASVDPDILDHVITINADRFTPIDQTGIPTGELRSVAGTAFDFLSPTRIGSRIDQDDEQLSFGRGYDHNFVLNAGGFAAQLYAPSTGRVLDMFTTLPGLQFYTGNFLDGTLVGKNGVAYGHRYALALEAQYFPDAPNQPHFPSTIVRPGEEYRARTRYRFSVAA